MRRVLGVSRFFRPALIRKLDIGGKDNESDTYMAIALLTVLYVSKACSRTPAIHASGFVDLYRKARKGQRNNFEKNLCLERSVPGKPFSDARLSMLEIEKINELLANVITTKIRTWK